MGRLCGQAAQLIVLAALMPGLLAYPAYSFVQEELGVARTGVVLYLSPGYAAAAAWALFGEVPGWFHAVGAALTLPAGRFTGPTPRRE
jgi:drug/metabolite transporter (DMT)-like permease